MAKYKSQSQQTVPSEVPDSEKGIDPAVQKDLAQMESIDYSQLEHQVRAEYNISYDHQQAKKQEALVRLKLYNNQRRDKDAVGDTTMFTIMQTILASLYTDRLEAEWIGREDGDDEVADNLTAMANYDYDEMEKDIADYEWDWDTLFFGRGLMNLTEYVRDPASNIFMPTPEVWDPTTFLRDPRATSVNGNTRSGKNGARFYGREIRMTRDAIEDNPNFFNNINWEDMKYGTSTRSLLDMAAQARADAQGMNYNRMKGEKELGDNAEYEITEWNTHWKVNGTLKRCTVWLANNRSKVIGFKVLGDPDKKWGLIDRPLYPTSHDWDGTSIPDLTEDKQRHRAVAQNLGLKAATADLYPNYIYDQNKVKNRNDLQFGFNKFVPADGPLNGNEIMPMRRASPNMQLLDFIYNTLDISAQKATATPEIQQGQQTTEKRTLGEVNIIQSKVDTRYSLSAKVFGWSEKRFWLQWYQLYKDNFESEIDQKVLRIVGAFGAKWRPLTRDNIIANIDPDVKIESRTVSRAQMMEDRQVMTAYFALALQDPTANKKYALWRLGRLNGMKKDELDRLFPPSIDEMQAEDENVLLNQNKPVKVLDGQDHVAHLEIHSMANQTRAAVAHIETTKHMLFIQKQKAMAQANQANGGAPGGPPPPGGAPPAIVGDLGSPLSGNPTPPREGVPALSGTPVPNPLEGGKGTRKGGGPSPIAPSQTSNQPG